MRRFRMDILIDIDDSDEKQELVTGEVENLVDSTIISLPVVLDTEIIRFEEV